MSQTPTKNLPQKGPSQKNAPEEKSPQFTVKETRLLADIKGGRDRVRALRTQFLTKGQHWDEVSGRIYLSSAGAEILLKNKDAILPEKDGAAAPGSNAVKIKGYLTWPKPANETLIAWAMPGFNHKLLVAYRPNTNPQDPTKLLSVRVQSNANFQRGDEITVSHVQANEFNLVGQCPTWRGEIARNKKVKAAANAK